MFHRYDLKNSNFSDDLFISDVAKRITEVRLQKGITQIELARRCGHEDPIYIDYIEQGKVNLSISSLSLLAKSLEVEPSDLLVSQINIQERNILSVIPELTVRDIYSSSNYFSQQLGFTLKERDAWFAIVSRDNVKIRLYKSHATSLSSQHMVLTDKSLSRGYERFLPGTSRCMIIVRNIDELHKEYIEKNLIKGGILHHNFGGKEITVLDNDNNQLVFFEI